MEKRKDEIYCATIKALGIYATVFTDGSFVIRTELTRNASKANEHHTNCIRLQKDDPYLLGAIQQLEEYFAGERKTFDVPLKLNGTEFQMQVWNELKKIPYGTVVTYKYIAEKLGNKSAVRGVGQANGANPIPIFIPCHRVINTGGKLGGYSGGGPEVKKRLLELEGYLDSDLFI